MNYKIGFKIKPDRIDSNGRVFFTDGTNEINPNQLSCEAYGYKYNPFTNTCSVDTIKLDALAFEKDNNTINGKENKLESRVTNTMISGNNNIAKGQNDSVFISGSNNTIANNVNNTAILSGSNAEAIRTGEVIVGGSKDDGLPTTTTGTSQFRTQTTTFHMTANHQIGDTFVFPSLSGKDGVFGIPMHINSLGFLEGTIIGASEGTGQRYMRKFTCCITKNSSGIADVSAISFSTPIIDSIGGITTNIVDGTQANSDTSSSIYDTGEVYVVLLHNLFGGSTKNIAWSISIKLVEQIHDLNANLTTN